MGPAVLTSPECGANGSTPRRPMDTFTIQIGYVQILLLVIAIILYGIYKNQKPPTL
jgi:hypothetical protein